MSYPVIKFGEGKVLICEGVHDGKNAIVFTTEGTGNMEEPRIVHPPRKVPEDATLAVLTFTNAKSIDKLIESLQAIREYVESGVIPYYAVENSVG